MADGKEMDDEYAIVFEARKAGMNDDAISANGLWLLKRDDERKATSCSRSVFSTNLHLSIDIL